MTGPQDSQETRPISVAELLARNGTIGAPPIGGRRRRRRGNTDSVTVAELTGEIPTLGDEDHPAEHPDEDDDEHTEPQGVTSTNGAPGRVAAPAKPAEPPVKPGRGPLIDPYEPVGYAEPNGVGAEQMRPDPVDDDEPFGGLALDDHPTAPEPQATDVPEPDEADEDDEDLPPYLRGEREHLFGGHSKGLGRGTSTGTHDDTDLLTKVPADDTPMARFLRGGWVVLQSVIAVAFGAGLFMAFNELWKWNNIVALVLSVLVILGLVVAVRIVRKTEDIASTLIAVAVGALVTLGPLALLQSS
jgi:hypothetical protein